MILAKINVSLIDKAKLFEGKKGRYLDVCLVETPDDRFGNDFVIFQSVSKEERERGIKGAILGNGRIIGDPGSKSRSEAPSVSNKANPVQVREEDDIPF